MNLYEFEGKKLFGKYGIAMPHGKEYYAILKNSIIGQGKELFERYWEDKFSNQKTHSGE